MSGADDQRAAEHERWIRQQVKVSRHDPSNGEAAMGWSVETIDRLRAELAETRAAGPTVGWVLHTSDADLMLHAQVVWQELRKRELTEPKTAEAREWADLHLRVVQALAETQAAGCGCQFDAAGRQYVDRCVCPPSADVQSDLAANLEREVHRLRARVAELEQHSRDLRFVGDELADEVEARDTEHGPLARDVQAWREAAASPDDAPTSEPRADDGTDLRELRIDVCENCLARKPGTCHVPGCFYIRHTIDEVPTHLDAYAVEDR